MPAHSIQKKYTDSLLYWTSHHVQVPSFSAFYEIKDFLRQRALPSLINALRGPL